MHGRRRWHGVPLDSSCKPAVLTVGALHVAVLLAVCVGRTLLRVATLLRMLALWVAMWVALWVAVLLIALLVTCLVVPVLAVALHRARADPARN